MKIHTLWKSILYEIDGSKAIPTKNLQDSLDSMLCGNEEFKMIDEQVVAFDFIMRAIEKVREDNKKHVIVMTGMLSTNGVTGILLLITLKPSGIFRMTILLQLILTLLTK